ncbi:MAG TPA: M20 family metallopeptidase [Synergistaceae bacterium]|nr:M20 family metallopeptidase [Synergistaceae bacterium]HPJ24767.1 M20 family metallopeptidase [Synergistaceae bacterium]HPQ37555.1 M20 family metallopeptidase [Synergistaceae bacterium]
MEEGRNEVHQTALELLTEAEELGEQIIGWRREFHQFPELGFEENITSTRVTQILEGIEGVEVIKGFGTPTSVLGILGKNLPGPAFVLRADMDALALEEETDLPYSSCMPGVMHACGHDSHMASLLGAAMLLSRREHLLKRKVIFLFQPAEEGKGGARTLVEKGLFSSFDIAEVVALHFWPLLPYGHFYSRPGTITSLSDRFHIEILGVGAHAASPHLGVDPIMIAAHVLFGIQHIISRERDPRESAVVTVGQIEAGDAYNIIPERVNMQGTLRAFTPETREFLQKRLESVVEGVCRTFNARSNIEYIQNYPRIWNDEKLTQEVLGKAELFFGEDAVHVLDTPLLAGEDFAFYSLEVPSTFFLIGTGTEYGLHHPKYDVPEDLLHLTAAWGAFLALFVRNGNPSEE